MIFQSQKLLLTSLIFITTIVSTQSQDIIGRVVSSHSTNKGLNHVQVALFNSDTVYINQTVTNSKGIYTLTVDSASSEVYLLHISSMGYAPVWKQIHTPKSVEKIELSKTDFPKEIKNIRYDDKNIEYYLQRKNIEKETKLCDIIQQIPSIQFHPNGTISRYNKPLLFVLSKGFYPEIIDYINLFDSLNKIEAQEVEKIVVADYKESGIDIIDGTIDYLSLVNIKIKKKKRALRGDVTLYGEKPTSHRNNYFKYGIKPSLQWTQGSLYGTLSLDQFDQRSPNGDEEIILQSPNRSIAMDKCIANHSVNSNINTHWGITSPKKRDSFSVDWSPVLASKFKDKGTQTIIITNKNSLNETLNSDLFRTVDRPLIEQKGGLNYHHKFKGNYGNDLSISHQFYFQNLEETTHFYDQYSNSDIENSEYQQIHHFSKGKYSVSAITHRFFDNKQNITLGTEIEGNYSFNQFTVDSLQSSTWIESKELSDQNQYHILNYNVWFEFKGMLNQLRYTVGYRNEYSHQWSKQYSLGNTYHYRYNSELAHAAITYTLDELNYFTIKYHQEVKRPNLNQIIPFSIYQNTYHIKQGNALLKPEYTHHLTWNYVYLDKYIFEANYQRGIHNIVTTIDVDPQSQRITQSVGNASIENRFTIKTVVPITLCKRLNIYAKAYIHYQTLTGNDGNIHYNHKIVYPDYFIKANYHTISHWGFSVVSQYNGQHFEGNNRVKSNFHTDMYINKMLTIKGAVKNANIKFTAIDIFNQQRNRQTNGDYRYKQYLATPSFSLSCSLPFSFNIGNP